MYKLLIPDDKKILEGEYRSRRKRAVFMLMSVLFAFTIIALLPALILALGRRNAGTLALSSAETSGPSAESQSLLAWAQAEKLKLAILAPAASSTPYEYFQEVLKSKPAGVRVTSLSYIRASKTLKVGGKSPDRQALLEFQTALASSGGFAKAEFPVDNLAKDKDIDFQLNLILR